VKWLAWIVAAIIIGLNLKLTFDVMREWRGALSPSAAAVLLVSAVIIVGSIGLLLVYMIFRPEAAEEPTAPVSAAEVIQSAEAIQRRFERIGVALEAQPRDAAMLAEAIALARTHHATLVLLHVVEGVGGQFHGRQADDAEFRNDEQYLRDLAERLRLDSTDGLAGVEYALGFGPVARALIDLVREHQIDLLVLGGHGHGRVADLVRGETITSVRHGLSIPVLTVRGTT
jgi:manganese transport protein